MNAKKEVDPGRRGTRLAILRWVVLTLALYWMNSLPQVGAVSCGLTPLVKLYRCNNLLGETWTKFFNAASATQFSVNLNDHFKKYAGSYSSGKAIYSKNQPFTCQTTGKTFSAARGCGYKSHIAAHTLGGKNTAMWCGINATFYPTTPPVNHTIFSKNNNP